ncbi:isoprenoid synthase domain-containing protein [Mycena galopus ATCC 62051]|nr:isoprenoid synthase domain-containing protein [Mycena galopus ATCC 62051]
MSTVVSLEETALVSTVPSSFPSAREHIRKDELTQATDSFFLETWPFQSQKERDLFVRFEGASWFCKCVPDGQFEKMIWACRVNALLFLVDDLLEKNSDDQGGSDLADRVIEIIGGEVVPRTGSPVEELMNCIFRGIEASTRIEQYRQFSRLTCEYLRHQETPVHRNIPDYLAFRRLNAAGYFVLATARYSLELYVTDDELQNPLLAECERLTIEADAMENDVVSYEKEVQDNTLGNNLVAILLQHGVEGRAFDSASAAMVYIRELIAQHEAKLQDAISVALNDKVLGKSDAVCSWLHALPYIVSGNTWWSQQTGRYKLPGKPVPRRVIHLEGVGDIVEPEL